MQVDQNLTSIKKNLTQEMANYFMSPSSQNILDDQLQQLQLLDQQQVTQKLKNKKQQILKQSEQVTKNCHQYFLDMTSSIIQIQNKIKKQIDKQTLDFLEKIDRRIEEIYDSQHSYNCSSQTYQTLKILHNNFIETEQNLEEVKKVLSKCYVTTLQGGLVEYNSDIVMSTNKIYLNNSQFNTTNKKIHGNTFQVSERQFELVLVKFQQRQEKLLITNERLKNKVKSLQQILSKKGLNIKEMNRINSAQNEKFSPQYWDLELQRVKGENLILKQEIGNISNKLIALTSQNQGLKGEYKRMLQSNISQVSNPNNTQSYEVLNNLNDNSQMINGFQTQHFIMQSQILIKQATEENESPSAICLNSNIQSSLIQNEMLIEYEKKNQQLSLQLTKKLKELEQLRSELLTHQKSISQLKVTNEQKQSEIQKISCHCSTLQHDYEISSKKRFELEEKINTLRETVKQKEEKQKSLTIETQLRIDNLQSMLKIKEQALVSLTSQIQNNLKSQYQEKLQQLTSSKQLLQKQMIICRNLMTELKQQNDTKIEKFKDQFKRMQKNIASKDQQLVNLREEIYQLNRSNQEKDQIKKDQNSLTFKQKYENNKKEITKIKKQLKQKTKDFDNLKSEHTKMNELLSIKTPQMNSRLEFIVKEMEKIRNIYESRIKLIEDKQKLMKERFQFNMAEILTQNEVKKINFSSDLIERYIESMNNFCSKNAQLKKIKQQLRDLKSNKSLTSNKGSKKQLTKDIDVLGFSLEQNSQEISEIEKTLFQDRLNIQKKVAEEKITILQEENKFLKDKLNSKQNQIKEIQQDINKIKKQVKKSQDSTKKQQNDQLISQNNSLHQKIQKLQNEIKSTKNLYKKSQDQLNVLQNQLKKKRDHITNVKKELTSHSDQVEILNFMIKNKNEQIEKLKRQLKDQATKEILLNQMKEKMQEFSKLEQVNDQLKRQLQKNNSLSRFQISKLQNEIKQIKAEKRQEMNQKINLKINQLNEELTDLKSKHKKLKSQLERKDTILQNLKLKSDSEVKEIQNQLQQITKELTKKTKEIQSYDKKIQILAINQKKYKQRCKLLTVIIEKVYSRISESSQGKKSKFLSSKLTKDNTESIVNNISPITKVIGSNFFNSTATPITIKRKDNPTLQTLAQLDINLEDIEKYSEGLQMFGVNPFELKNMQTGLYDPQNQNSTFSHYMTSPETKKQNDRQDYRSKSPQRNGKFNQNSKEKIEKLTNCLNEKQQLNVSEILNIFEEVIQSKY